MEMEKIEFNTVELLSLYATMAVKRIVITNTAVLESLTSLSEVVERNLKILKVEKKWFLATLRDHARLHHRDWSNVQGGEDVGRMRFNSILLVLSLRIGLEKLWSADGNVSFEEDLIQDLLSRLCPTLSLTELNQKDILFDYFAKNSPNLQTLLLPLSDNNTFRKVMAFKNLRVLELARGVSDKVLCSCLWGIDKKSEKLLDLVLKSKKEVSKVQLSLPHLQVLRSNMFQEAESTMHIHIGAVALVLQPKLETVESLEFWDTYDAVVHLLDMEAKHKNGSNSDRQFNVTHLPLDLEGIKLKDVKEVVKACPKITSLTFKNNSSFRRKFEELSPFIPLKQVTKLDVDTTMLSDIELILLLCKTSNLRDLTLRVMPQDIMRLNLPITYSEEENQDGDGDTFPDIKSLTLDFLPNDIIGIEYSTARILGFLSAFPRVEKLYLTNTLLAPGPFLVFGCIGGALALLKELNHLSVIMCHEDLPGDLTSPKLLDVITDQELDNKMLRMLVGHCMDVPNLLMNLQDEVTFRHLRGLKTFIVDEVYLQRNLDYMIEALRLAGVLVSVLYRPNVRKPQKRTFLGKVFVDPLNLLDLEDGPAHVVKKHFRVTKYKTVYR